MKSCQQIYELKAKSSLRFFMRGRAIHAVSFPKGERGVALRGKAEQRTVRDKDEGYIKGHTGHARTKLHEVTSPQGRGCSVASQPLRLALVTNYDTGSPDLDDSFMG